MRLLAAEVFVTFVRWVSMASQWVSPCALTVRLEESLRVFRVQALVWLVTLVNTSMLQDGTSAPTVQLEPTYPRRALLSVMRVHMVNTRTREDPHPALTVLRGALRIVGIEHVLLAVSDITGPTGPVLRALLRGPPSLILEPLSSTVYAMWGTMALFRLMTACANLVPMWLDYRALK